VTGRPVSTQQQPAAAAPHVREAGAGARDSVVCVHSNAASSSQWRALFERLAPRWHVLAPDSYGSGKSPPWTAARPMTLADEVALIEPVLARAAGGRCALVGHSYGGAVCLKAALQRPGRVSALVLYEPTLFALLAGADDAALPPDAARGIRETVERSAAAIDAGDLDAASRAFIDYWMGSGAWDAMPEPRRAPIRGSVVLIRHWSNALMHEPTPRAAFAALDVPALLMVGGASPASSRAVARVLARTLPRVEVVEFDGLGHMAPVTHADVVNDAIAAFLERHAADAPAASS